MTFQDVQVYREWMAIRLAEHVQLAKARTIAEKAAFNDLPKNEQQTYIALALKALKELEPS